jgi:hypothetical protein
VQPPTSEPHQRPPNPYFLAVGVVLALFVVFGFPGLYLVVRILIAFAVVAAGAYLGVLFARRR